MTAPCQFHIRQTAVEVDAMAQAIAVERGAYARQLAALGRSSRAQEDALGRSWLKTCVQVGLAGLVLGLLVGGVFL